MISVAVESYGETENTNRYEWLSQDVSLDSGGLANAVNDALGKHFLHFPSINITNGTTEHFKILWTTMIPFQRFANSTSPKDDNGGDYAWTNSPNGYASRAVRFSTAPGGQPPDIEATVNSCTEPTEADSVAIRLAEVRETYDEGYPCPVLKTDVKPAKCLFKSNAEELAANVSVAMLDEMRCKEGTWQAIKAPCPREDESLALPQVWGRNGRYWHWVLPH